MKFNLSLNIGPSKISSATYDDINFFIKNKLGEISHRSQEFSEISRNSVSELKKYFSIPDDYIALWGSSATEMMEISVKSLVQKTSFHFTCGAFSERFAIVSNKLGKNSISQKAAWGELNDFSVQIPKEAELISMTQCETSTGIAINPTKISEVKSRLSDDQLLAIDATSIAGIVPVKIKDADIWLFSVQKCFGLPAGLGVMFCHKKVLEKAKEKNLKSGQLSLMDMAAKMQKNFQTIRTPNVLAIYLLGQQVKRWNEEGGIDKMHEKSREKNDYLTKLVSESPHLDFLVKNAPDRSLSVHCLKGKPDTISKIYKLAQDQKTLIGGGYGPLKETTIRLPNFPNIELQDLDKFREILEKL